MGNEVRFFEYNLSQFHRPDDITRIFEEIARSKDEPKLVLLDEFDVRIGTSSVIRYIIQPMYDGKIFGNPIGKTAFMFSGSYLSTKDLLSVIQREASQIDLQKFVFDYLLTTSGSLDEVTHGGGRYDLFHMFDAYRRYQEESSSERDSMLYLRQLDKVTDFISRINGFAVELPELSAPLELTDPPYALLTEGGGLQAQPRDSRVAEKMIKWVESETFMGN